MTKILIRGGTAAQWTASNPVLASREPGVETDTGKMKFGDGITAWNSLVYFSPPSSTPTPTGMFGDGSDGTVVLDGVVTVPWASLSGSTYTLMRDVRCASLTINAGITVLMNGARLFCTGTLTNAGTMAARGNNGSANGSAGALSGTIYMIGGGSGGGAGNTGAGSGGSGRVSGNAALAQSGTGGAGGTGSGGSGGNGGTSADNGTWQYLNPVVWLSGSIFWNNTFEAPGGGLGGGGGGGDATNKGGGGGAGGAVVCIFARTVVNSGTITASGGNGGTPTTGNCGGGGSGSGGTVIVFTTTAWTNTGTVSAPAGTPGSGVGTGTAGAAGGSGFVANQVLS